METLLPTRHPERPHDVPAMIALYSGLLRIPPPTDEEWQRLGELLTVGDEPMDRLVDWMYAVGMRNARPLFEAALAEGIAQVPDAPGPLREFFQRVEAVPDWVDGDRVARGQRAMRSAGSDGLSLARDVALLGGYMFSGFNKTLVRTGALEKGSNKRFAETAQWALDVIAEDGLAPGADGYRSTIRVRLVHAIVRRHVGAMPDWRPEEWGLPVNQTDMSVTLLGALVAPPIAGLGMGIVLTPGDLDAIAHMTRYVGWLIGVDEDLLPHNHRDAVRHLHHAMMALSEPDETTRLLAIPMAQDPMTWQYDRFVGLRRRVARAQHLSITSAFLGPGVMRSLGLPAFTPPWYPLVRLPLNLTRSAAMYLLPGGKDRAAARGYREQEDFVRTLGVTDPTVGHSAHHLTGAA